MFKWIIRNFAKNSFLNLSHAYAKNTGPTAQGLNGFERLALPEL
jgi:hypothetical protein